jgi:dTDP-4-amino-4,6-dideoxygalactose transaminase
MFWPRAIGPHGALIRRASQLTESEARGTMAAIPIMRPRLPRAERLAIYLNKIDEARVYSNFGPLTASLEERIASHFRLSDGAVATVANGTLGLWLALLAQAARPGTLCVLPAWTFIASVQAAMMAGLTPFFVDVDARTWALEPAQTACSR